MSSKLPLAILALALLAAGCSSAAEPQVTTTRVRQILGRPGEVWGAESAADQLIVIRQVGS